MEQPGLNVPEEEENSILAEYAELNDDVLDDSVFAPGAIPILLVATPNNVDNNDVDTNNIVGGIFGLKH